jgi:hypothetical protein
MTKGFAESPREAGFRYGLVLGITALVLLFSIVAPSAEWSRAVATPLTACMLLVVAVTSGAPAHIRRWGAAVISIVLVAGTVLVATGVASKGATLGASGVLAALTLPTLVAGIIRLLRARGVTVQAVTGALAIYLLIGLVFAYCIGAVAEASSRPYFAQAGKGTQSERAYFSLTVLTTTGLGDFTPATRTGRALTVVEELIGQLYLVTVVALLVANVGRRPRRGPS